jgi:hypothetical protein
MVGRVHVGPAGVLPDGSLRERMMMVFVPALPQASKFIGPLKPEKTGIINL